VPLLLLKIHKIVWQRDDLPSFLPHDDVPADCLVDLKTDENELSLWHVEDDKSNLNRVVTALASNAGFVSNFDYLLFDYNVVTSLGLKINRTDGKTPDRVANRSWHRDLVELSGKRISEFAIGVFYNGEAERVTKKKILELLKAAVAANEVDQSKLASRIASEVLSAPLRPVQRFLRRSRQTWSAIKSSWQE